MQACPAATPAIADDDPVVTVPQRRLRPAHVVDVEDS